ncbi:glycerol-3-phosphate dehydrogenase [Candidatus Woesearchaeota archaeon]|jgi:glycerol-3-phosphate dehydrogenase (NAD(P)+)|nr:glycerol-3-phosphate dehydrogenase [Candidatus Woesearchaeota archaeon]
MNMKKISIIGAGSWGTTLAILAAGNGNDVTLWVREKEIMQTINEKRENKDYLPGVKIPNKVHAENSIEKAISNADAVVNAIPAQFTREIAKKYSKYVNCDVVVNVAKGIEIGTYKRMSEVLKEELGDISIVTLSGPNHSEEVSRKMPTATVIASEDVNCLKNIKKIFHTNYFRVFTHDDIIGIEICGALKNITAIATGVCDGLGYGDNAKASIITIGLMEMSTYGRFLGAKRATFYGLAGVGDLVATCTSKHSRNRLVGEKIAGGKKIDDIRKEMKGMIAEGMQTTKAVYEFSKKNNLYMPLTEQAYHVIYENKDLKEAISDLLKIE